MGMYDTVMVRCPACATPSEFQTKSGPCMLDTFTLEEAPDDVLEDVNRHAPATCEKCGTRFGVAITGRRPVRTLNATSVVWPEESKEEPR